MSINFQFVLCIRIMEEWRDVPEYEGRYKVSNTGKVKSLDRMVAFGPQKRNVNGKIINQYTKKNGYKVVFLSRKMFYTHQVVAMAFLDHKPNGFNLTVDHIDFDKSNNNVTNLRLISHKENSSRTRKSTKPLQ